MIPLDFFERRWLDFDRVERLVPTIGVLGLWFKGISSNDVEARFKSKGLAASYFTFGADNITGATGSSS